MPLDEKTFLTVFVATACGRSSNSVSLAEKTDSTAMSRVAKEAIKNAPIWWAEVSGKDISSTPSKKPKSKTTDITDKQWGFLTIAQFEDDKLNQKEFGFVTDRFKCGKNQELTEIQSNWIDRLIKKIGD